MILTLGQTAMLWPLSWDDDNWRSMLHFLGMYNHALSVVIRRRQLTEHVLYMNYMLPCSDRCLEIMTYYGAWFIPKRYITMLWPLSWDDCNWRSIIHTWMIYNHALTVVIRWSQLKEHYSYLRDILPCSDRCHETIATEVACFIHEWYITILWPLSLDDDNWQNMIYT